MMNRILSLAACVTLLQASLVVAFSFQATNIEMNLSRRINTNLKSAVVDEDLATGTRSLPPLIQNMADERREFEVNLGKAMDTLRKDYPNMLHKQPEFDIYHEDISVVDPSGVQLTGIKNYQHSFSFLQTLVRFFYNTSASTVQNRMVYDFARQSIRISWNAVLIPKVIGNRRNALYVDGISIYKMDSASGKIVEHRVERMLINNTPVVPPYGVLTALRDELMNPTHQRVPAGVGVGVGAMFDTN
jgi:hypothetical protein